MRLSKLLLAVLGATVVLGALVASASAGRLEFSDSSLRVTWTALTFRGGIGNWNCEIRLESTLHARSMTKTVALIGYVTAGTVLRCSFGGVTINQGSLPWHRRYKSFAGTLPNITGIEETMTGAEWRMREPTFGITCTVRAAETSIIDTYAISSGTITSGAPSGSFRCEGIEGRVEGTTTNVDNRAGSRITVRLI